MLKTLVSDASQEILAIEPWSTILICHKCTISGLCAELEIVKRIILRLFCLYIVFFLIRSFTTKGVFWRALFKIGDTWECFLELDRSQPSQSDDTGRHPHNVLWNIG